MLLLQLLERISWYIAKICELFNSANKNKRIVNEFINNLKMYRIIYRIKKKKIVEILTIKFGKKIGKQNLINFL